MDAPIITYELNNSNNNNIDNNANNNNANNNNNNNKIKTYIYEDEYNLYEVNFLKKNNKIIIKCSNTSNDNDIIYSYKLTEEEITRTTSCHDITKFMGKIEKNKDKLEIKKINNCLLLQIFLDKDKKESKTIKLEELSEEKELEEDIDNLDDAIRAIKLLIKENKDVKKKINSIENNFKDYENKMDLNLAYNFIDKNSYKLDNIYKTLHSKDIIQSKDEFGLINMGFQHIFKKNIILMKCLYKLENNDYDFKEFNEILSKNEFLIIIIFTKDKKRFGALYNNNIINNNNMNNLNIGNNINNNNNIINANLINQNGIIFNSASCLNDYFVFSLDTMKIFYSCSQETNNIPYFSLLYDTNRQSLYGRENSFQINNQFILSGRQEFNIKDFELYEINIGYL